MKLVLLFLTSALATQAPRIELDLTALEQKQYAVRDGLKDIYRAHHLSSNDHVISRHDYGAVCQAGKNTNLQNCPFPIAKAYDRHNGDISDRIKTRVFKVDVDGKRCGTSAFDCGCATSTDKLCQVTQVSYGQRSTYLFKYDVTDEAGNHAEQVVFSLVLNDHTDPTIENTGVAAEQWEAASCTELTRGAFASDELNVDTALFSDQKHLKYDILRVDEDGESPLCTNEDYKTYVDYTGSPIIPRCASSGTPTSSSTLGTAVPCAMTALDTSKTGKFVVRFHTCDAAGVYGKNEQNNCVQTHKAVLIKDTQGPVVQLKGFSPVYQECHWSHLGHANCATYNDESSKWEPLYPTPPNCHRYIDAGANVVDRLDTELNGENLEGECGDVKTKCLDTTGHVDSSIRDVPYEIKYQAYDIAGNQGEQVTRVVKVRDTKKPTIKLVGESIVRLDDGDDVGVVEQNDKHARCLDNCRRDDAAYGNVTGAWKAGLAPAGQIQNWTVVERGWIGRPLNTSVIGSYIRMYECDDGSSVSHNTYTTRTFIVEDTNVPEITVRPFHVRIEANISACDECDYVDEGEIRCTDYATHERRTDTNLNKFIIVGGDIVDRRTPGQYVLSYDCTDRAGLKAVTAYRTVTVHDSTPPTLKRVGPSQIPVEAGFNYTDMGAEAYDAIDGEITGKVVTSGDQVNTIKAFSSKRSCYEIKLSFPGAESGDYWIATKPTSGDDKDKWTQTRVYCDFSQPDIVSKTPDEFIPLMQSSTWTHTHTYKVVSGDDMCKVYQPDVTDCLCSKFGLDMASFNADLERLRDNEERFSPFIPGSFTPSDDEKQFTYVCGLNNEGRSRELNPHPVMPELVRHAMPGTYIIKYSVTDAAGNSVTASEAEAQWRTVTVQDTFQPVITLHLMGKRVHQSAGGSSKINGASNPASDPAVNPHLADGYASSLRYTDNALDRIVTDATSGTEKTQDLYSQNDDYTKDYHGYAKAGDWQESINLMAEQSSASSTVWLVGAASAAIAGLALLVYGQKRQAVVSSVPV